MSAASQPRSSCPAAFTSGTDHVSEVADAIVHVVGPPFGKRPFGLHMDPTQDGADVGFTVLDRGRAEMLHRAGFVGFGEAVRADMMGLRATHGRSVP